MSIANTEKLKGLIQASNILSPSERAEWTGLLELMNDKQMLELEKILTDAVQKKMARQQPGVETILSLTPKQAQPNKPVAGVKSPALALPSAPAIPTPKALPKAAEAAVDKINHETAESVPQARGQLPKLSHLMNLPRMTMSGRHADADKPVQVISQPVKTKQVSGFLSKLKAILSEKELPPGEADHELELPAHTEPVAVFKKTPPVMVQPELNKAATAAPFNDKTQQVINIFADKVVLGEGQELAVTPAGDKNVKTQLKTAVPDGEKVSPVRVLPTPKLQEKPLPPPLGVRPNLQTTPDKFTPGLSVPKLSDKEKAESLASISGKMQANFTQPVAPAKNGLGTKIVLNSLNELNALDSKVLQNADFNSLVKSLKNLVVKYGYHEVVFNIEKSPLFKDYISTGSELLNKQQTFEQLDSAVFLDRQLFEETADLLRQIQTG